MHIQLYSPVHNDHFFLLLQLIIMLRVALSYVAVWTGQQFLIIFDIICIVRKITKIRVYENIAKFYTIFQQENAPFVVQLWLDQVILLGSFKLFLPLPLAHRALSFL